MTEEIIKECEFYLPLSENCNEILDRNGNEIYKCSSRQDCYYKKLIRLEQDRKQLIQWLDEARRNADFWCDKCTSLEQENKELRAEIESFMNGDYCAGGCKKMNNAFCDAHTAIINENNKLRSALEEIRVIADDTFKVCDDNCGNARKIKLIIDRINEVLND